LFFDENVSPKVARALKALGENAGGTGSTKGLGAMRVKKLT
jgi:hypothetical protein